jgi:hypothetical protein
VTGLDEFSTIGRLFAQGRFFENGRNSPNLPATICRDESQVILTENGLGFILGEFFTNTSGHPGGDQFHLINHMAASLCHDHGSIEKLLYDLIQKEGYLEAI